MKKRIDYPIDFVILWVDGNDTAWRKERAKYDDSFSSDNGEERYRDWGLLRYWFRGVEKYAPWVNRIHFVTWGHVPLFLNTENEKIHVVRHEDFIPMEYLPLFNSNAIEIFLNRIPGLAEHFVLFNDDVFLINSVKKEYFFLDGVPVDIFAFQPIVANKSNPCMSYIYMNNSLALAKKYDKYSFVKSNFGKVFYIGYPPLYFFYNLLELVFPKFTGFYTSHSASPLLKSTMDEVWEENETELCATARNRFRSPNDVSQYLFREWQKLSGGFVPRNTVRSFKYFDITNEWKEACAVILRKKKKIICLNDEKTVDYGDIIKTELSKAFETCLNERCMFEK